MNLDVDTLIHEIGAGQMEINFLHGDPLGLADKVFFFKRTLREAALKHDMYATFMAKPMAGEPGSAMHVHQSVVDAKTGRNIFSDEDGSPSFKHWYIGGLQRYMPSAMAIVRAVRQFLPPHRAPHRRADQHPVGHRQPHRGLPRAGIGRAGPPRREPHHRRRRQSLPGAGRDAGLRLPRHDRALEPTPMSRAAPTRWRSNCRKACRKRCSCCARRTCAKCWATAS
jgi:hypothetical protein